MSDISVSVRSKLISDSNVTSLVGSRIYPSALPQNADLPAIRYETSIQRPINKLSGGAGFAISTVSVDIIAESHIAAYNVQQAVRESLQGWTGTAGSTEFASVSAVNIREDFIEPIDASDVGRYRVNMDFEIIHEQTIPTH
tara:strand:+ start:318 stop:740 length:423 start_codon:yes stop_codon:yes gene_type:complete